MSWERRRTNLTSGRASDPSTESHSIPRNVKLVVRMRLDFSPDEKEPGLHQKGKSLLQVGKADLERRAQDQDVVQVKDRPDTQTTKLGLHPLGQ